MMRINISRKSLQVLAALLLTGGAAKAQYDAMFTQYMFNEMFINPAYAGSKEAMSATLLHRQQWVNFPGRPVTTSFSLHGPLMQNKMGLGLSILSEKVGAFNRNLVYGSYAYRLKIDEKSNLAFGLMAGLENQVSRFSNIKVSDISGAPADPQFAQNTPNLNAMNFGTGVYYTSTNYYVGLSIPRLLDNSARLNYIGNTVKVTKLDPALFTYYLTGGYVHKVNDDLRLKGTAMIKAVKNAPAQLDLGANALINEMIWAGLAYRSNSSMSLLLGMQVNKQFLVSYSFDYGLNKIQKYSQGSHEIVLNYLFAFKGKKISSPRYF
jgi:type IX secretion system PorP/SprF family membrane protein